MKVTVRARIPKIKVPREDRLAILTALRRSSAYRESLLAVQGTFETWSQQNRPTVNKSDQSLGTRFAGGEIVVSFNIESDIWRWLDEGYWRHVRMSPFFVPKTQPNSLLSGPGGGPRAPIGYQSPPIWVEARDWTRQLQEFGEDALRADAQNILRDILHDTGLDLWAM